MLFFIVDDVLIRWDHAGVNLIRFGFFISVAIMVSITCNFLEYIAYLLFELHKRIHLSKYYPPV